MSVEEIKSGISSLSREELEQVTDHLFHVRLTTDPDYLRRVEQNLADDNPDNWYSLEEVKRLLDDEPA